MGKAKAKGKAKVAAKSKRLADDESVPKAKTKAVKKEKSAATPATPAPKRNARATPGPVPKHGPRATPEPVASTSRSALTDSATGEPAPKKKANRSKKVTSDAALELETSTDATALNATVAPVPSATARATQGPEAASEQRATPGPVASTSASTPASVPMEASPLTTKPKPKPRPVRRSNSVLMPPTVVSENAVAQRATPGLATANPEHVPTDTMSDNTASHAEAKPPPVQVSQSAPMPATEVPQHASALRATPGPVAPTFLPTLLDIPMGESTEAKARPSAATYPTRFPEAPCATASADFWSSSPSTSSPDVPRFGQSQGASAATSASATSSSGDEHRSHTTTSSRDARRSRGMSSGDDSRPHGDSSSEGGLSRSSDHDLEIGNLALDDYVDDYVDDMDVDDPAAGPSRDRSATVTMLNTTSFRPRPIAPAPQTDWTTDDETHGSSSHAESDTSNRSRKRRDAPSHSPEAEKQEKKARTASTKEKRHSLFAIALPDDTGDEIHPRRRLSVTQEDIPNMLKPMTYLPVTSGKRAGKKPAVHRQR
jgi:hypothetical protein